MEESRKKVDAASERARLKAEYKKIMSESSITEVGGDSGKGKKRSSREARLDKNETSSFFLSSNASNANARDKKRALNSSSGQSTYSIRKEINVESETSSSNIIKKKGNNRGLKYGTSNKEKSLSCGARKDVSTFLVSGK